MRKIRKQKELFGYGILLFILLSILIVISTRIQTVQITGNAQYKKDEVVKMISKRIGIITAFTPL